jgi:SAM-dependent methyltransferase
MKCWCGAASLHAFSSTYFVCTSCRTLVSKQNPGVNVTRVGDDERDFYGREYWFSRQETDLGYPNIVKRARADLPERCIHWLRTTLKYRLPPARALELGSGSGAFVALLQWAGFEATGLELSPSIVEFSREAFAIDVFQGPIEDQKIPPASYDVIAAMDVLEHLPDPLRTIKRCMRLLKPDGVLIIQTPRFPEDRSYKDLLREGHRFVDQLKPDEHVYLFSESSVTEFLRRLGASHLVFEPAMFPHYDMCLVASRRPLVSASSAEVEERLKLRAAGRIVQALLDAEARFSSLLRVYQESEDDRGARLRRIEVLEKALAESEADRGAQVKGFGALERRLAESEADRAARLERIAVLEKRLAESEADRTAQAASLQAVQARLTEAARELAERQEQLEEERVQLRRVQFQHDALEEQRARLRVDLILAHSGIQALRGSVVYRVMRRLNRWQRLAEVIDQMGLPSVRGSSPAKPVDRCQTAPGGPHRIVVDLTPVLPGGENGGAKLLALGLVGHLAEADRKTEWVSIDDGGQSL